MVLLDQIFHYGGDWIYNPQVLYSRKLVHTVKGYNSDQLSYNYLVNEFTSKLGFIGVQQVIVNGPSGRYYEIESDQGVRSLLSLVSDQFNVIDFFAVDECELSINVHNIVQHIESNTSELDATTDCSSDDSEERGCHSSDSSDCSDIESDSLERLHTQKERKISDKLTDYKELHKSMTFKDIPEARKFINMYSLANGYGLKQLKSCPQKLRYRCLDEDCPFVCHISKDFKGPGVKFKTLKVEHKCNTAYDNHRVSAKTIAAYFKRGLQDNPKIKIKEMMASEKAAFNINVSHLKCKRAMRMILEKMEGSFADDYNKLEAYVNELRSSNPGTDVMINISKDALSEGKRIFLRMYICFHELKMGFKSGLRPFIGLDGTFLKGKCKGQLLVAVAQDSIKHFYPLAWAVVDKRPK
ncbi:PREDICTED: uncharacterized protein LOC109224180 [Nicotiana attenuata]|uniref:uncharacterized protein LOC109224180 n=1 Tax=Nicotiana attenuata TaxID=49451 RepID=UPI000905364E|nr:PREDICTED: uncharacterized protein LOC109224180 [Nicotiana attenuata]